MADHSGKRGQGVAIELRHLSFSYSGTPALSDLDLSLPCGKVTAILGPSGSGKSTLLALIAGLARPVRGEILFDGRAVAHLPPEKRQLGMVFQDYALFPHLDVTDNVAFGLAVRGGGRRRSRERVSETLARFGVAHLARRYPRELSGGERQRVALARALAYSPRALLLDEPLSALDARLRLSLRSELAIHLKRTGATVVYVTHDQEEAMALGERVAVLDGGRLEQVGAPEDLYRRPASTFVAEFIGEANFLSVSWSPQERRISAPIGDWLLAPRDAARFDGLSRGRLLVRPEALLLAGPGEAHFEATVVRSLFLGGRRRLEVESAGVLLKVDLPPTTSPGIGDRLSFAIDFSNAVLVPANGEGREEVS